MRWKIEFTDTFRKELESLPQRYQKLQAKAALEQIVDLEDPRTIGGKYLGEWAYTFGSKSLLQCSIDEQTKTIVFTKVTL